MNSHKSLLLILFLILSMCLIYIRIFKKRSSSLVKKNILNIVKMELDEFSFAFAAVTFYCVACQERVAQALTLL